MEARSEIMFHVNLDEEEDENKNLIESSQQKHYDTFNPQETNDSPTQWAVLPNVTSILNSINHYLPSWQSIKYYLPSYKNFLFLSGSLISSLPLITYAFGFPTGTAPQHFSMDWFLELSIYYQVASIVNTILFIGIETLIRYDHLPTVLSRLLEIIKSSCTSLGDALSFISIAFFSITAAIAGGGLGYASYSWYPSFAPVSALLNSGIVLGYRIEFMASFYEYIKKKFAEDPQFQQVIIQLLEKLKADYAQEFDELFVDDEINDETAEKFLEVLFNRALQAEKKSESLFNTPSCGGQIKNYAGQGTDIVSAGVFGVAFGTFFAVNGYLGLEILCDLMTSECILDELPRIEQVLMAVIIGFSSGVLGFMTGIDLRKMVETSYEHIKKHPYDIVKLLAILTASSIQATTILVACNDIIDRGNVFRLADGLLGTLFAGTNSILIGGFCYKSLYQLFIHKAEHSLNTKNLASWLNQHELPHETIASLRQHGFFNQNEKVEDKLICSQDMRLANV